MEQPKMTASLDLNALLSAYNKEEFMLKVFKGVIKENPEILASALANYVVMDLIKSNEITAIAEKTKAAVAQSLDDFKNTWNSPIKSEMNKLIAESVGMQKDLINKAVAQQVQEQTTHDVIVRQATTLVERKITEALIYAGREE